jgi:hypothetical protein
MFILSHLGSSSYCVSPSSWTPTPGAVQAVDGAVEHGPQATHIGKDLTPDKAAVAGIAAPKAPKVVTSYGSPTPVLDPTAMTPIGPSTGVSTLRPEMDVTSASTVNGDDIAEEPEVIHRHSLLRAPWGVSHDEVMGTTHWALSQVQEVLHRERGDVDDERQRLLLQALMLKERTTSEKARAHVRERHINTREELLERQWATVNKLDAASQKMLSDTKELYATAMTRANTTIKQEELAVHIHAVAERKLALEELEQRL